MDEVYEYSRLKQSMEMVGFSIDKQMKYALSYYQYYRIFFEWCLISFPVFPRLLSILSAVLHLGNIEFSKVSLVSQTLKV